MRKEQRIFDRDNNKCRVCGSDGDGIRLVLAHIRLKCHAGDDRDSNLITLCRKCYNNVPNDVIRKKFETPENKREFDIAFQKRVDEYCPYTKYIYAQFRNNGIKRSRPQIDKFVKANLKSDKDFRIIKDILDKNPKDVLIIMQLCILHKINYKQAIEKLKESKQWQHGNFG